MESVAELEIDFPRIIPAKTTKRQAVMLFVSTVDTSTGACYGGDSPRTCQLGDSGRNEFRGPDFFWSDFYITKWFQLRERARRIMENGEGLEKASGTIWAQLARPKEQMQ